jgi:predicted GIY-YIG superfamily endonuclease
MSFFVYILLSTDNCTYVGSTTDLDRRLRQHNKEIKGGAFATGAKVSNGQIWVRVAHVENFPDWQAALQFEWRLKQLSRRISISINPLHRRMIALKQLLKLERPTSKAKAYTEWAQAPKVVLEDDEARKYYELL